MAIDFREITEAPKLALGLVDDPVRHDAIEKFIDSTGPILETAMRAAIQTLVEEINAQLAPHARVRLVYEGSKLTAEVVPLTDEKNKGWSLRLDNDDVSKVLVRMPSSIKNLAAESAQRAGVSMNSWTVNILERALENLRRETPENESKDEKPDT